MEALNLEFAERLKNALLNAGQSIRPTDLAIQFTLQSRKDGGVSMPAARKWLRGEALPTEDKLRTLAAWLNVDPHELRYGVSPNKQLADKLKTLPYANSSEVASIEKFLALPPEQRKTVSAVIDAFALAQVPQT
jgi:transcriptional regulator with XRE-family HTH domain